MKRKFENFTILIASIIIGIPLGLVVGLVVGLICWFKFPYEVYLEARAKLTKRRMEEAIEFIRQHEKENSVEGMWERHIERMESKQKKYDN